MSHWLRDVLSGRPWWMNAIMIFCAYMTFIYLPWDLFWKAVAEDREVWFGYSFSGWGAKFTALGHWFVYAALFYGFRRMRPWVRYAAAAYVLQITFGMFVWSALAYGSWTGWALGTIAAIPFAALTLLIWNSGDSFEGEHSLRDRYGEWALVTGASSGIGAEFARALAREGISCVLTARGEARLAALAAELERDFGVSTRTIAVDLTDRDGAQRLVDALRDIEISILVNNAGVGYAGRFQRQEVDRLRDLVELNCVAPVVLTNLLLPSMASRRRGAVIFTGSISGRQAIPLHAAYSASKVFTQYIGEALWVELRESGVDVLVLEPGSTAGTGFQDSAGQLPHAGESPRKVVQVGLAALGHQPSVISSWLSWARAEIAARLAPRTLVSHVAHGIMSKHTPSENR